VTAVSLDGYSLAAVVVLALAVVFVITVAARLIKRDQSIRIARFGIFIEREHFNGDEQITERKEWPKP